MAQDLAQHVAEDTCRVAVGWAHLLCTHPNTHTHWVVSEGSRHPSNSHRALLWVHEAASVLCCPRTLGGGPMVRVPLPHSGLLPWGVSICSQGPAYLNPLTLPSSHHTRPPPPGGALRVASHKPRPAGAAGQEHRGQRQERCVAGRGGQQKSRVIAVEQVEQGGGGNMHSAEGLLLCMCCRFPCAERTLWPSQLEPCELNLCIIYPHKYKCLAV